MFKINTEPRFIIAIAVAIVLFATIIIVKTYSCSGIECWGSKAQIKTYIDNPALINKIKMANKRWAFSDSFARARVFEKRHKNKWFADWWKTDHWEYTVFDKYKSKQECYRSAYKTVHMKLYPKDKPLAKMVKHINSKSPVRCFPAGTPLAQRWMFKPPKNVD